MFGGVQMSIGDLEEWCINHQVAPDDEDSPFCDYDIKFDDDKSEFRVFITTKRLISLCQQADHICADATYKLVHQGYPILIVGTTDRSRQFHPFGLAITYDETHVSFEFIFNCVKNMSSKYHDYNYHPTYLIADAAEAITNGFIEVNCRR